MIHILSPKEIEKTPGFVMRITHKLFARGGLDTSVMIKWLQEEMDFDVVTLTLDVGQEKNDLEAIAKKAEKTWGSVNYH